MLFHNKNLFGFVIYIIHEARMLLHDNVLNSVYCGHLMENSL